eukprot:1006448-Pelagomonas_calceolata.AAC.2
MSYRIREVAGCICAGGNVLHRREARAVFQDWLSWLCSCCEQLPECVDFRPLAWNALHEEHNTEVQVVPGHQIVAWNI